MLDELKASAAECGLKPEGLRRADVIVRKGYERGLYTASVWWVMRGGKLALCEAIGNINPEEPAANPCTPYTIFDIASITKPITAILLLQAVERGELHLGEPLVHFLPETSGTALADLTVRQLATHTSGLPPFIPLHQHAPASGLESILKVKLDSTPGTRYTYSDLGYILIGALLTRLSGKRLHDLARTAIFEPLGMRDTCYLPDELARARCAPTRNCEVRGVDTVLRGEVHDPNSHYLGGAAGHAGIFSTAEDLARLAIALQFPETAKKLFQPSLLSSRALKKLRENQLDSSVGSHSIGMFTVPSGYLPQGDLLSSKCYGHSGFTGTLVLIDPEADLAILWLTNRVYSREDGGIILQLRRHLANTVAASLVD